ncbi:hypothetical protein GEMRC1_001850 [Eukaryota sp. GEM-RC1]
MQESAARWQVRVDLSNESTIVVSSMYVRLFPSIIEILAFSGPSGISLNRLYQQLLFKHSSLKDDDFVYIFNSLINHVQYKTDLWIKPQSLMDPAIPLISIHPLTFQISSQPSSVRLGVTNNVFSSYIGIPSSTFSTYSDQRTAVLAAIAVGGQKGVIQSDLPRLCNLEHQGSKEANKTVFFHVKCLLEDDLIIRIPVSTTVGKSTIATNRLILKHFALSSKVKASNEASDDVISERIRPRVNSAQAMSTYLSFLFIGKFIRLNYVKDELAKRGIARNPFLETTRALIEDELIEKVVIDYDGERIVAARLIEPDKARALILSSNHSHDDDPDDNPTSQSFLLYQSLPLSFLCQPYNTIKPFALSNVPLDLQVIHMVNNTAHEGGLTGCSGVYLSKVLTCYPKLITALGKELSDKKVVKKMNVQSGKTQQQFFGASSSSQKFKNSCDFQKCYSHISDDNETGDVEEGFDVDEVKSITRENSKFSKFRTIQSIQRENRLLEIIRQSMAISSLCLHRELQKWHDSRTEIIQKIDRKTVATLIEHLSAKKEILIVEDNSIEPMEIIVDSQWFQTLSSSDQNSIDQTSVFKSAIDQHAVFMKSCRAHVSATEGTKRKFFKLSKAPEDSQSGTAYEESLFLHGKWCRIKYFHLLLVSQLLVHRQSNMYFPSKLSEVMTVRDYMTLFELPSQFPSLIDIDSDYGINIISKPINELPNDLQALLATNFYSKISKLNNFLIKLKLIHYDSENNCFKLSLSLSCLTLLT